MIILVKMKLKKNVETGAKRGRKVKGKKKILLWSLSNSFLLNLVVIFLL